MPFIAGNASDFDGDEFITNEFITIDIAYIEERIAVEFDGPSHFLGFKRTGGDPKGKTKMKLRVTKEIGLEGCIHSMV